MGENTQEGLGDKDGGGLGGAKQLEDDDPISGQFGRMMQVGIYEELGVCSSSSTEKT